MEQVSIRAGAVLLPALLAAAWPLPASAQGVMNAGDGN